MIDAGLALARWLQFAVTVLLFGVPAFALYGVGPEEVSREHAWLRRLLGFAGGLGLIAAALLLSAEAAEMSGDAAMATNPETIWTVASATTFGVVWTLRTAALSVALVLIFAFPRRVGLGALTLIGAVVAASLAWIGHGGEGGAILGMVHRFADVVHILAASFWIGALVVLLHLLGIADKSAVQHALVRFSGVGPLVVATLVFTGAINTWALVQTRLIGEALRTPYALALEIKLGLFAGMLAFAALNRWVLTPRLAAQADVPATTLRRSVIAETALAFLVIAAVAILGVLEPPGAG